jgi:hypothetical protein
VKVEPRAIDSPFRYGNGCFGPPATSRVVPNRALAAAHFARPRSHCTPCYCRCVSTVANACKHRRGVDRYATRASRRRVDLTRTACCLAWRRYCCAGAQVVDRPGSSEWVARACVRVPFPRRERMCVHFVHVVCLN